MIIKTYKYYKTVTLNRAKIQKLVMGWWGQNEELGFHTQAPLSSFTTVHSIKRNVIQPSVVK
jgi:hypothetical protein